MKQPAGQDSNDNGRTSSRVPGASVVRSVSGDVEKRRHLREHFYRLTVGGRRPAATNPRIAASARRDAASTFTWIILSGRSGSALARSPSITMPALLTNTVMLALLRSTCSIRARSTLLVRSALMTSAERLVCPVMCSEIAFSRSSFRATNSNLYPRLPPIMKNYAGAFATATS